MWSESLLLLLLLLVLVLLIVEMLTKTDNLSILLVI